MVTWFGACLLATCIYLGIVTLSKGLSETNQLLKRIAKALEKK